MNLASATPTEKAFAERMDREGKTWFFQPRAFPLTRGHYRPDFYVIEDACFYEVIGTRQAYSYRRVKMALFRAEYPHLTLRVANMGAWSDGPKQPRVAVPVASPVIGGTGTLGPTTAQHLALWKERYPASPLREVAFSFMTRHRLRTMTATARRLGICQSTLSMALRMKHGQASVLAAFQSHA